MLNNSGATEVNTSNQAKQKKSILSRVKTALVVLPILFSMFYYPFLYLILMFIVIFISHKEYYNIELNITKKIFKDQFSDSTSSILIGSPLQTYIILLLPLLIYSFQNSEPFSIALVTFLLVVYRLSSFIYLYNSNKPKETNTPEEEKESLNKTENGSKLSSIKNNFNQQYITTKMMNACLVVISLDFIFLFTYAMPLCYGISLHHLEVGFTYVSLVVVIAYSCDVGALFGGLKFGKTQFGAPITPTKTKEGVYCGIILAIFNSLLFRFIVLYLTNVAFFSDSIFMLFTIIVIVTSIFGDFFESFLKRCGDIKDSGTIFPGHGGLLDRIDSITLGLPVCYYFIKLNKVINIPV